VVKIQAEIDQLKRESNDQKYMEKKKQKIESLEATLAKIRK
jgi:hypothetical protein